MKLDKKGFTVIELILSFALVMFLAISMFALVSNYRNREERESIKRDLLILKNTLTQDIYQDVLERKVYNMTYCKNDEGNILKQCVDVKFQDGTLKRLQVVNESVETEEDGTRFSYDTFNIIYGGVEYKNPDPKFAKIIDDYILTMTTTNDELEYGVIYKIKIRVAHQDIDEEYVIEIITTGVK